MARGIGSDHDSTLRDRQRVTRALVIALAVAAAAWVALFILRVHAHQPNVDDYLYADTARSLSKSSNPVSAFLHTGQTSPLVPALAAPGVALWGINGGLAVELPLFLLLVAGTFVLARTWVSPPAALVIALAAGLNVEALQYSMMLNFAIASSAAAVWCFASYFRSDHLRDWRWASAFGVALAALALSRSMAPVYVVPLALVVGCDYLLDVRARGSLWRWPAALALGIVLVLAGPWWVVSGHEAVHYLVNAGYNPSAGYNFVDRGFVLTPAAIKDRITFELLQLGWLQSCVLGGAVVAAVILGVVNRARLNWRSLWMLLAWSLATTLFLSTSSNLGTAFGLPVLIMVIVLCGAVLGQQPADALRWALVPLAGLVVVGFAFQFTSSTSNWWPGPTYRAQVLLAGGSSRTNVELITHQVAHAIGKEPTALTVSDPILNENGLEWELGSTSTLLAPPLSQSETAATLQDLRRARALVTGGSLVSFFGALDETAVDKAAFADGFRPDQLWAVDKSDDIIVWRRGRQRLNLGPYAPVTTVAVPKTGAVVKGEYYLVARASALLGVTNVEFEITGGNAHAGQLITAAPFPYGWLGPWNTAGSPDGVYRIRSVAQDAAGRIRRSPVVVVHVRN